jgi:hypothetical protein
MTKTPTKLMETIAFALSSSQLSKLDLLHLSIPSSMLEQKQNRALLSVATEINPPAPRCQNITMRNTARERRFGQEQKQLFSRLLSSSRPFQHTPQ